MTGRILIYGANGYTGELTARFARDQDTDCIVAGRSAEKVRAVSGRYGFESRVFSLADPSGVERGLSGVAVVLHCAGPFSRTSKPMADACLRQGVHYLDITGEVSVFEALAARSEEARRASVMLMPGAGFDVVPSDCLAAYVASKVTAASELVLAFRGLGGISHGTMTTMAENLHRGGFVRKNGKLTQIVTGSLVRQIDYGDGVLRRSMAIVWGDISTAFHTTGISNIEVYVPATAAMIAGARVVSRLGGLLSSKPVRRLIQSRIDARPAGPTDAERARGKSMLFAEARSASGAQARAWLETPEGYTLTALTSLEIARRVAAGGARPGFQTPAGLFGADFVLGFDGVRRRDAS
jgi:short subunit dehydrogenase-like uncharacterized protein